MEEKAGGVVFEHVTKRYGDVIAVDDVSFRVAPGELVTLLGPSGCGKTTTLRMVAGLEAVSGGRVLIVMMLIAIWIIQKLVGERRIGRRAAVTPGTNVGELGSAA